MPEKYSPAFCREAVAEAKADPEDFLDKVAIHCKNVTIEEVVRSFDKWGIPVPSHYRNRSKKNR